jgi:DNA-binding transcriptional MerR regulator
VPALDIAEVAQRSGLPASALRFYEDKGLIQSIGTGGLRRIFEETVLERLALISVGRASGFSLGAIAQMFGAGGSRVAIDRQMLAAKADELEVTIRKLTAMRDGLRHAADCPKPVTWSVPSSGGSSKPRVQQLGLAAAKHLDAAELATIMCDKADPTSRPRPGR